MLAATIVSRGNDGDIQHVFDVVADTSRPSWLRSALLRGAEVHAAWRRCGNGARARRARSGAGRAVPDLSRRPRRPWRSVSLPDGPRRRRADAAVRRAAADAAPDAPPSSWTREPAIVALAARNDDLSTRARDVLARLEWPGKPGVAAVAPLSAAEQARFDAGKLVYQNLCQACHQPDGRGRDKLAPPLVGSDLRAGRRSRDSDPASC